MTMNSENLSSADWGMLGRLCTRDEAGKHFTEIYSADWLGRMEVAGMIEIARPIHTPAGVAYSPEYWSIEVKPKAIEEGEACGWGAE